MSLQPDFHPNVGMVSDLEELDQEVLCLELQPSPIHGTMAKLSVS